MNEIEIIYHYSKEYEGLDINYVNEHASAEAITLMLNGVKILSGDNDYDEAFAKVEGFLLACKKLLTYHSIKYKYLIDLDY